MRVCSVCYKFLLRSSIFFPFIIFSFKNSSVCAYLHTSLYIFPATSQLIQPGWAWPKEKRGCESKSTEGIALPLNLVRSEVLSRSWHNGGNQARGKIVAILPFNVSFHHFEYICTSLLARPKDGIYVLKILREHIFYNAAKFRNLATQT